VWKSTCVRLCSYLFIVCVCKKGRCISVFVPVSSFVSEGFWRDCLRDCAHGGMPVCVRLMYLCVCARVHDNWM